MVPKKENNPLKKENRARSLIISFMLIGFMLFAPAICWAATTCIRDGEPDTVLCPPPGGNLVKDTNGNVVCGIGWCVTNSKGNVKCSMVPGGAAILSGHGDSLCVGGCLEASGSLCLKIQLPK